MFISCKLLLTKGYLALYLIYQTNKNTRKMQNLKKVLTEGELKVLLAVCEAAVDSTGGDFTYADEVQTDFNSQQLGGYLTQLSQKGFLYISDDAFKQICNAYDNCDDLYELFELIK